MPTTLRASLASLLVTPGACLAAFWWGLQFADGRLMSPWPWLALIGAFAVVAPAAGRWAGVRDWGFIPFLMVAGVAVPWWGTAILLHLLLVAPAGVLVGVLFWFCALGLLMLLSLVVG